jgi:hypothetical protein
MAGPSFPQLVHVLQSARFLLSGERAVKCSVCGQDYGVAHNCAGVAAFIPPEESAPPPAGFAPFYYLRMALHIARWDEVAIRRASRDFNAVFYGAFFWTVAAVAILLVSLLPRIPKSAKISGPALMLGLIVGVIVGLVYMAFLTFVQLGLCHLIAKWFFGGTGSYMGVMRPLLLGWFVNALILIPFVGILAASIAWIAVLMLVFEEVDGIGRLQAFLISAGINVCILALQFMFLIRQ